MIPLIILAIENDDDREFMSQLYLDNKYIMYSEIKKLVSDAWDTEDIMQDSLVRLIDKIDVLRKLNQRRRINYLITTVRNQAKNYHRSRDRRNSVSLDDEEKALYSKVADDVDVEEQVFRKDQMTRLKEIWPELSEETQQLFERKYILKQSDAEIAEAFGIKSGSDRMKLTRARKEALLLLDERP